MAPTENLKESIRKRAWIAVDAVAGIVTITTDGQNRAPKMDDREHALMQRLHDLQIELFNHQGDEIDALSKAIESLSRSHEIIGDMLKLTSDLIGRRGH